MDDLISRQAAIDVVIKHLQLYYEYARGVREAINGLPTADLSEYSDKLWVSAYERGKKEASPIRCDECKHWDIEWIPAIGDGHYCPMMDQVMVGDEWCCYAERKSDG